MSRFLLPWLLILPEILGCGLQHTGLKAGQMDLYWYLDQDVWPQAKPPQLSIKGKTIPTKWTFNSTGDARSAALSLAMAAMQVARGQVHEVAIPISPEQARSAANMIRGIRDTLENLHVTVQHGVAGWRWAQLSAKAVVVVETISRSASAQPVQGQAGEDGPGSLLRVLLETLGEQLDSRVLTDRPENAGQLRERLMDAVLRAAFAAAGHKPPEGLSRQVMAILDQHAEPAKAQPKLQRTLLDRLEQAPPSDSKEISHILQEALVWAPPILQDIEQFARQWDRIQSVSVEFRKHDDGAAVAITVKAIKGKQVRLNGGALQPDLVFQGDCRVTIQPRLAATGQTIVLMEGGGACRVEFTGLGFALARLAVPLASGTLRELRIASCSTYRGPNELDVLMLMEADGGGDRRRIGVFHSSYVKAPDRQVFSVQIKTSDRHRMGLYVTPARLYSYPLPG